MTKRYLSAIAATYMLASAASAQHLPITALDVAGIHLGDAPAAAEARLRAAGYRIDTSTAPSFRQDVAIEAARRRGQPAPRYNDAGVARLIGTGPRTEHIEVAFIQTAAGPKVAEVTVLVPATAMDWAAAKAQLSGKYGPPDAVRSMGTELSWCSAPAMKVCGALSVPNGTLSNQYPIIEASQRSGLFLALRQGQIADRQAQRDREAAVEALAPKTNHGAF